MKRLPASVFLLLSATSLPLHAATVSVTGRVLGPEDRPAAGVKVALIPVLPEAEAARLELAGKINAEPAATAATDGAGIFHLTAPDAGMWRVTVAAPGFVPLEALLVPLLDETELPDARLLPDAGLEVRVNDPRGQPLAHGWVRAESARPPSLSPGTWQVPLRRIAFTDANGSATFPRAREEVVTLRAAAPGALPAERKNVRGGSTVLSLTTGRTRQIQVRDPQGKGVPGVFVTANESAWVAGRTAESGLLDLAVPDHGIDLRLTATDGRQLAYRLRPAKPDENGPAVIVLRKAEPASGRIVSAQDGRPLAGALAWLSTDFGATVRAGTDGMFRFPDLPEEGGVTAAAPGFFPGDGQVLGKRLSTFALQPRLTASGVVVDEAGRPVVGASLEASYLPDRLQAVKGYTVYRSGGFARSAPSGRFRLSGLLAGVAYGLRIDREGFAPARLELPAREAGKPTPDLRIVLRAGRTLFGTVIDAGRRPVAGARVSLRAAAPTGFQARLQASHEDSSRRDERSAPTDATGRFELKNLAAGTLDLTVRARGFAPLTVPALAVPEGTGATDAGTVMLAPGVSIRGLVADAKGNPIDGAEVCAKAPQREEVPSFTRDDPGPADAVTAADGSFVLEDRSPGETLDLAVTHPGYGPAAAPGVAAPSETPVRIVLQPTARVAGRTLDPDGKPVAGASLLLSEQESKSFGGQSALMSSGRFHHGTTDDEGGFSFDGVSPGPFTLSARAPRRQEAELANLEVKAGQDLTGLDLVLAPGAEVAGKVLSPEGRPVPDAEVAVVQPSDNPYPAYSPLRATTDADGQYRIEGISPGKHTLEAHAEGYRRAVRDVELTPAAAAVDFALERGLEASGRVVDDAGNPVPGARLLLITGQNVFDSPHAVSEADGTFRFSGLQDGTYRLVARKDGYTSDRKGTAVTLTGAPVSGLEVRLAGGGMITGRLTGVEPSRLSRVQVSANRRELGRVDPEGVYQILHLAPGKWSVTAVVPDTPLHAEGEVTLEPGATEVRLDLQLGGGRTLTGVVTSNGEPLAGAPLSLARPRTETRQTAATDHQGGFRFGGLEDGVYDLDVSTPKGAQHHESVEISGDREIRVELRTASLAGRVLDAADSSPVSGVRISLRPTVEGPAPFEDATTDTRGAFRLLEVGDGAWTLRATREGYAPAEREVRVDGPIPEEIELRLEPTEGVTVEALLTTGQAPDRIRAAALDAGGKVVASGIYPTGENGRTRISNVPPGSWQLLIQADQSAPATVPASVPGPTVHAILPPGGEVRVQVPALASGATTATIVLTGAGGPYRGFDWDGSVKSEWELAGGAINLPRVPAGVWQLAVRSADGRSWSGTATVTPGGAAEVVLK